PRIALVRRTGVPDAGLESDGSHRVQGRATAPETRRGPGPASPDGRTNLLFSPLTLRGVTAKNRVVASPMCQYSADHGRPTEWHEAHHVKFAMGGLAIG